MHWINGTLKGTLLYSIQLFTHTKKTTFFRVGAFELFYLMEGGLRLIFFLKPHLRKATFS